MCKLIQRLLVAATLCGLALSWAAQSGGATEDTVKRSSELARRSARTYEDVNKYVTQLDKTQQALASMSKAGAKDLKKRYDSFSSELHDLEEAQNRATTDFHEMKSSGAQYFAAWETSIVQMSNPELKQTSAERRSTLLKDHEELAASLAKIADDLRPFMSDLQDLKEFIGADLSPENIGKATAMIEKSQADTLELKNKITGVQATLKQFSDEVPR